MPPVRLTNEAYGPLGLTLYVSDPVERSDEHWYVAVGHDWPSYEHDRASMRLRKLQDHYGMGGRPTAEETASMPAEVQGFRGSLYSFLLPAWTEEEATHARQMFVADVEGKGFTVIDASAPMGHPYR